MKRIHPLLSVAVTAGFLLLGAQSALAVNDFCNTVTATECQVTGPHPGTNGAFTIDRTLHIFAGGSLTTSGGAALSINITPSGDFLMDNTAQIIGNFATGTGSAITITLDNGDVDLAPGSIIRSNGLSGGAIKITTTATHTIDIDGLVESVGSISGTGANQRPGGGTITIVAGCALTVSDDGKISSRGQDPGADLVHLQGCTVVIDGIVESTGPGHTAPNNPANHCNLDTAAHPPGGAAFFSACVEIWGDTVTINSIAPHKGEVRTDPPGARNPGRGWIDVFARNDITINNDTTGAYSVHSNSQAAGNNSNSFGGLVTVKSALGNVTTSGLAISANGPGLGSNGGDVIVQAFGDVAFGTATIQAAAGTGANAAGGHISAKAFNGALTGAAPGALNAAAGAGATAGTVLLEACTNDPGPVVGGYNGTVTGTRTNHGPGGAFCGGAPTFPVVPQWNTGQSATQFIAAAAACSTTLCVGTCSKSGVKFNDANNNKTKDASDPLLGGWEITLWNEDQTAVLGTKNTAAGTGAYLFDGLAPGTYVVCETPQAGWNQTFPPAGAGIVACANGTLGYKFTLSPDVNGCVDNGNDFGNFLPAKKSGVKWNDVNGDGIRQAGDNGLGGWTINLWNQTQTALVTGPGITNPAITAAGTGFYQFNNLLPGTYVACEVPKVGWTQTFPVAPPVFPVVACTNEGTRGYTFTVAAGDNHTGNDFGNHTVQQECKKQTVIDIMNATYPGNAGPDVTVHTNLGESVQAAVTGATDTNGDGYIIVMVIAHADGSLGGTANQKVVVSKDYGTAQPFGLFGCSVTLTGGGSGPAILITDAASSKEILVNGRATTIFLADLHGGNSAVGLEADGTKRYIRNEQPSGNTTGIKVLGNSNTVHNGVVQGSSGVGLQVDGNSNLVTDTQVYSSGSNGIQITGNSNSVLKTKSGDIGKGNGGDGVNVSGNSNVLQENTSRANTLDGFRIPSGTGNTFFKNVSGGTLSQNNGSCEYDVAAGNVNNGQNTANNVTVPGAVGSPFPTGCIGSP